MLGYFKGGGKIEMFLLALYCSVTGDRGEMIQSWALTYFRSRPRAYSLQITIFRLTIRP